MPDDLQQASCKIHPLIQLSINQTSDCVQKSGSEEDQIYIYSISVYERLSISFAHPFASPVSTLHMPYIKGGGEA